MELQPNKLILPKTYISWTQLSCWLSNPARYHKEYFENSSKLDTRYLQYGKGIAKMIEELTNNPELKFDREWVKKSFGLELEDERVQLFFENIIMYDTPEHEIKCLVLGVPILSYLDSYNSIENVLREYKTGKIAWTKAKVQKHDQLTFYATALKWSTGKMPEYCDLDWIETKDEIVEKIDGLYNGTGDKIVNITGRIISFHRQFDDREIARMENLIVRVAQEISEAYIKYLEEQFI